MDKVVINPTYTKLAVEEVEQNGVLVKRSVFKVQDNRELIGKFKSSDFALENLIALGNPANFREVNFGSSMSVNSVMETFQNYEKSIQTPPQETSA